MGDAGFRQTPVGRAWIRRLAGQIARQQAPEDVAIVVKLLGDSTLPASVIGELFTHLRPPPGSPFQRQLESLKKGSARATWDRLVTRALATLENPKASVEDRVRAIPLLALAGIDQHADRLARLLAPHEVGVVQETALETLAQGRSPEIADRILARWSQLSPVRRRQAADLLVTRPAWAIRWLAAIESGTVQPADVGPSRWQLLRQHPDPEVRRRAEAVARKVQTGAGKRREVIRRYRQALAMKGDPARGQAVFRKHCAACHRLAGIGHEIGPPLAAMKQRGAEAILVNILDPNREVNPEYLTYTAQMVDGRVLTGIIAAETANSIVLRRADNASDTVLRVEIEDLKSTGQSLMPTGFEEHLSLRDMADLIAFLMQAP
ncbi:MAG TPA: c-type cytochrome [Bryobacterales bacterium]|nr:c-type cytochrome [Bryobacterales bacterium]